MKFSMYANFPELLHSEGIEKAAAYAKSLGFSSVEMLEFIYKEKPECVKSVEDAKYIRKVLTSHGLSVSCYSVAVGLYEEGMTADTVTRAEKKLMQYADRAAALGSPFLHHTLTLGTPTEKLTVEETLEAILPAAIRVATYAHSLGVTCIYEDQGPFFNGVEGFGRFFWAIKEACPYVGVCGDMGNTLFVDESPVDFFRAYAEEIKHVHIKDYTLHTQRDERHGWSVSTGGTWLRGAVIGQGQIDLASCLAELRRVGYNGIFSFENTHDVPFADGVRMGMDFLQKNA